MTSLTNLTRAHAFILSIAVTFLLPLAILGVGLDYGSSFFLIAVFVLLAWFIFRWDRVKEISQRSGKTEILLGASIVAADYAFNALRASSVGVLDLLVIFLGTVIASYGVRSLKLFWVPATYGIILLVGYQIENLIPNLVALQDWLAGVMASILSAIGISSTATGALVTMNTSNGTSLLLDVRESCTGLEGILAFGILSTMVLLDLKPKMSRVVPIFAIGFAGAFLTNILRLLVEFLTYEYAGVDAGLTMHVYFGYVVFIAWVVAFLALAFKYLAPVKIPVTQPSSMPPELSHPRTV
jgi:exosortase/archaeosortase family protein